VLPAGCRRRGPPATLATISANLDMRTPMASWVGDIWLDAAYLPLSFGITDGFLVAAECGTRSVSALTHYRPDA
jgi:hypothetical protein